MRQPPVAAAAALKTGGSGRAGKGTNSGSRKVAEASGNAAAADEAPPAPPRRA
jgi:hypothetical protein